jgi:hypothetical protein
MAGRSRAELAVEARRDGARAVCTHEIERTPLGHPRRGMVVAPGSPDWGVCAVREGCLCLEAGTGGTDCDSVHLHLLAESEHSPPSPELGPRCRKPLVVVAASKRSRARGGFLVPCATTAVGRMDPETMADGTARMVGVHQGDMLDSLVVNGRQ